MSTRLNLTEVEHYALLSLLRRGTPDGKPRMASRKEVRRAASVLRALGAAEFDERIRTVQQAAEDEALARAEASGVTNAQGVAASEGSVAVTRFLNRLSRTQPARVADDGTPMPYILSAADAEYLRDEMEEEDKASRLVLAEAVLWRSLTDKVDEAARTAEAGTNGAEAAEPGSSV